MDYNNDSFRIIVDDTYKLHRQLLYSGKDWNIYIGVSEAGYYVHKTRVDCLHFFSPGWIYSKKEFEERLQMCLEEHFDKLL